MLRFLTAGESHGPALTAILEGMVAGVPVSEKEIKAELARRRHGYGRGTRMKLEEDRLEILGGIRHGRTIGSPIAVVVHNTEWPYGRCRDRGPRAHTAAPGSRRSCGDAEVRLRRSAADPRASERA
jgi:chorismate synthase